MRPDQFSPGYRKGNAAINHHATYGTRQVTSVRIAEKVKALEACWHDMSRKVHRFTKERDYHNAAIYRAKADAVQDAIAKLGQMAYEEQRVYEAGQISRTRQTALKVHSDGPTGERIRFLSQSKTRITTIVD